MRPRTWVALVAGCLVLAAAPAAAAQADTVTATGTGQSAVHPKNRNNNASIVSAYDAARQAAIGGALKEAHRVRAGIRERCGTDAGICAVGVRRPEQRLLRAGPVRRAIRSQPILRNVAPADLQEGEERTAQGGRHQEGAPLHRPAPGLRHPHRDLLGHLARSDEAAGARTRRFAASPPESCEARSADALRPPLLGCEIRPETARDLMGRLARVLGQPEDRRAGRDQERHRDQQGVVGGADEGRGAVAGADRVEEDRADDRDPQRHRELLD